MKPRLIVLAIAAAAILYSLTSCITSESTVTAPDGTVTVTKISGPSNAAVDAAAAIAYARIIDTK